MLTKPVCQEYNYTNCALFVTAKYSETGVIDYAGFTDYKRFLPGF